MKLYENAWPSKYEEIKTWYPVWYREVLEMDALWRAFGKQLDEVQAGIIQSVDNNFIDYADAQAITKLEAFLGIVYDSPRTLAERRNVVKAFILGNGHIGQKEIKELVSVFTNGEIDVALVGGMIEVTVTRDFGDRFNLYDCHLVLDPRIPAHLALGLVDNLLPVSVFNDERLIFRDLKIGLAVQEGSAQLTGISLNGERLLDGTWNLEASYQGIQLIEFNVGLAFSSFEAQGLTAQALTISAFPIPNVFGLASGVGFAVAVQNRKNFKPVQTSFAGLRAAQTYNFTGKVIMDSRWALDGTYTLNGSKSLKSTIIEEEL